MPSRPAASRSTLSTPTPQRTTARHFRSRFNDASVSFMLWKTIRAAASAARSTISLSTAACNKATSAIGPRTDRSTVASVREAVTATRQRSTMPALASHDNTCDYATDQQQNEHGRNDPADE